MSNKLIDVLQMKMNITQRNKLETLAYWISGPFLRKHFLEMIWSLIIN